MENKTKHYILNGASPDNLDPIVNEAIEIVPTLSTQFNLYRTKMRNPQKCRLEY